MSQDARKRERVFAEVKDQNDSNTESPKRTKALSFFPKLKPQAQASNDAIESIRDRLRALEVEHEIETEKLFTATERLAELNEEKKKLTKVMFSYLEKGINRSEQLQVTRFSRDRGLISDQFLQSLKEDLALDGITLEIKNP